MRRTLATTVLVLLAGAASAQQEAAEEVLGLREDSAPELTLAQEQYDPGIDQAEFDPGIDSETGFGRWDVNGDQVLDAAEWREVGPAPVFQAWDLDDNARLDRDEVAMMRRLDEDADALLQEGEWNSAELGD